MIDRTALLDEIQSGPLASQIAPLLSTSADQAVADLLNDPTEDGYRELNTRELLMWVAENSRLSRLQAAAIDSNNSDVIRSLCGVALKLLDRPDAVLDLAITNIYNLTAALVVANIFTSDDFDSLLALATTKVSRAELIGLVPRGSVITAIDIGNIR